MNSHFADNKIKLEWLEVRRLEVGTLIWPLLSSGSVDFMGILQLEVK